MAGEAGSLTTREPRIGTVLRIGDRMGYGMWVASRKEVQPSRISWCAPALRCTQGRYGGRKVLKGLTLGLRARKVIDQNFVPH